ncbi:MAG: Hsp70 family protein, partial [Nocardioidaceae bacterium]
MGIDVGTTYTAAAVWRYGRAEIASLGTHGATIPTVVLVRDDFTVLTGESAVRRSVTEPERVAREFKRRVGDPAPLLLGGSPWSAESLLAEMLKAVVAHVSTEQGEAPERVVVTHPANWGPYKLDLLRQAVRQADLPATELLSEPEAAAVHYASTERVEPG